MVEIILSGWCIDRNLQVLNKMLEEAEIKEFVENGVFKEDKFTTDQILSDAAKNKISEYFKAFSEQDEIKRRKASVQAKVDKLLAETDYVTIRQYEQEKKDGPKKLTDEQFEAIMDYRQALRDLPNSITTDSEPTWPTKPATI